MLMAGEHQPPWSGVRCHLAQVLWHPQGMDERSPEERMSSGVWHVAEQRASLQGKPLPRRVAGAAVPTLASQMGLPNRIERLIRIERETERIARRLRGMWFEEAERAGGDEAAFARAWRARVSRVSFLEVNDLVDEHNEWFPVEARLRWDLALEDYRAPFGLPWRKQHIGVEWALERFPADLAAVPTDTAA
jgi:hypothetical protein